MDGGEVPAWPRCRPNTADGEATPVDSELIAVLLTGGGANGFEKMSPEGFLGGGLGIGSE